MMPDFTLYFDLALTVTSIVFVASAVFTRDDTSQTNLLAWAIMAHVLTLN